MHERHTLGCALVVLASSTLAQDRDPFDLKCLTADQRARIAGVANKLSKEANILERNEAWKKLVADKNALAEEAEECEKRRREGIFGDLSPDIDDCKAKFNRLKHLSQREKTELRFLLTTQDIIIRQLHIERSAFPQCK